MKHILIVHFLFVLSTMYCQTSNINECSLDSLPAQITADIVESAYSGMDTTQFGIAFNPVDDLRLKSTIKGNSEVHSDLVFYNFWFTACSPCIKEIPMLNTLVEEYGNRVKFCAITFEQDTTLQEFLKQNQFNFDHFLVSREQLTMYLMSGYPTSVITFKDKIVYFSTGGPPESYKYADDVLCLRRILYSKIINKLLDERKVDSNFYFGL